ncbi:MAG: type II toxin-antitoxin system RelE/ParE family toxin [Firmicutes bacterium]|nr:type II toxin-antitoxin system RelE/ParE family toxin [Bacillota bacterium]
MEKQNISLVASFFDALEKTYLRIKENPHQFPKDELDVLNIQGYRRAYIYDLGYVVFFRIESDIVNIVGIFSEKQDYYAHLVNEDTSGYRAKKGVSNG